MIRAQAFALLTSPGARKMFDLSEEPDEMKERYGRTRFGQSCLLGRRLVEHGVPFVLNCCSYLDTMTGRRSNSVFWRMPAEKLKWARHSSTRQYMRNGSG
jgi:hypothetical protein